MKLRIVEIEATADELKASTSIADALTNQLRNILSPLSYSRFEDIDEEDDEE